MIKRVAPTGSGVYVLSNAEKWIYVGETNSIERRLLEHLNETNTCIKRANPTLFTWEECAARDRASRQDQLILELNPRCNQKLG
jgi:predicted GIY-YIG superfamily endonuclease